MKILTFYKTESEHITKRSWVQIPAQEGEKATYIDPFSHSRNSKNEQAVVNLVNTVQYKAFQDGGLQNAHLLGNNKFHKIHGRVQVSVVLFRWT